MTGVNRRARRQFPLNGRALRTGIQIEGRPRRRRARPRADFQRVSPDYFKTISVPILRRRSLSESDREERRLPRSSTNRSPAISGRERTR
jgi:hypothetical protein